MFGTWLKEEGRPTWLDGGSRGEVRLVQGSPGLTVVLYDDESCWYKQGKAEIAPQGRGEWLTGFQGRVYAPLVPLD